MSKSSTIMTDLLPSPHPGEVLLEEFLKPFGLSQNALARGLHVPPRRINEIVLGKRAITADTDLRLARYFGMSEGFFLALQADFDLMARRREIKSDLETIEPLSPKAAMREGWDREFAAMAEAGDDQLIDDDRPGSTSKSLAKWWEEAPSSEDFMAKRDQPNTAERERS